MTTLPPAPPRRHDQADHGAGGYLSTGCLRGEHGYCGSGQGAADAKRPAECKFCGARCTCTDRACVHGTEGAPG